MQIYHGTSAHNLDEIVEYGALLCPLDLGVQRHLKIQQKGYFRTQLSKEELEKLLWEDALKRKQEDPSYEYNRQAYIYVAPHPHPGFIRGTTLSVILGFDVPSSMIINGLMIYRSLPLGFLNTALYLENTNLVLVKEALRNYDVPYAFYDYKTGKIYPGERSLVSV